QVVACRTLNLCGRERPARERRHLEQVQTADTPGPKRYAGRRLVSERQTCCHQPAGVEPAATGSVVCTSGMWEVLHRPTRGDMGSRAEKNASVRGGCRRWHSSQRLSCNGTDRVKARQERASVPRAVW